MSKRLAVLAFLLLVAAPGSAGKVPNNTAGDQPTFIDLVDVQTGCSEGNLAITDSDGTTGCGGIAPISKTCTGDDKFSAFDAPTGAFTCSPDVGGGGGEANTYSSLGGGLAVIGTKTGVDLPFSSFSATDFDLATNLFTIDASITRDSEVPGLETDPGVPLLALADLGDLCVGGESTRRNAGDTLNECFTASVGAHFTPNADPAVDHSSYVAGHGDGANCTAGFGAGGVDAAGAAQDCVDFITAGEVPANETDPGVPLLALADLGDLCAGGESARRNAGDTLNECFTASTGAHSTECSTSSCSLNTATTKAGSTIGIAGSCTNQFVRAVNGSAAPTCAAVATTDVTDGTLDALDLDTELRTEQGPRLLWEAVDAADEWVFRLPPFTGTILGVECECYGGTSFTINLCDGEDTGDDTCATSILGGTLTCTTTGASDTTLSAAGFAARDKVTLVVTATSGTCVGEVDLWVRRD